MGGNTRRRPGMCQEQGAICSHHRDKVPNDNVVGTRARLLWHFDHFVSGWAKAGEDKGLATRPTGQGHYNKQRAFEARRDEEVSSGHGILTARHLAAQKLVSTPTLIPGHYALYRMQESARRVRNPAKLFLDGVPLQIKWRTMRSKRT